MAGTLGRRQLTAQGRGPAAEGRRQRAPVRPCGLRVRAGPGTTPVRTGWAHGPFRRCGDLVMAEKTPRFRFTFKAPANGRVRKADVAVIDAAGKTVHSDKADLAVAGERRRVARETAKKLGVEEGPLAEDLSKVWNEELDKRRRAEEAAASGSPEAAPAAAAAQPAAATRLVDLALAAGAELTHAPDGQ